MSRENILILLGLMTMLAPYSGLPISWLEFILPAIGLIVVLIASMVRASQRSIEAPSEPVV